MTHNSSVNLSSYIFYFGQEDLNFDTFESAGESYCQIPHVILKTTSYYFFKFCISLSCHER